MTVTEQAARVAVEKRLLLPDAPVVQNRRTLPNDVREIRLSSELRADLLDSESWAPILEAYGRAVKVAVALTDTDGRMLGLCHNPQPLWSFVRRSDTRPPEACPFCALPHGRCTAIADALRMGT